MNLILHSDVFKSLSLITRERIQHGFLNGSKQPAQPINKIITEDNYESPT